MINILTEIKDTIMKKPEVLAPIQDFMSLNAAIEAGADAVFFGVRGYNMRVNAKNFTVEDLPEIAKIAHKAQVKIYLALNIIVYEEEIEGMDAILVKAKEAGVDAIICWDLSVVRRAKKIGLEVHLSTQASVSNSEAALFYKELGISRIVLARECNIEQITEIRKKADIEIEAFIHGAMCISVSGRCFLSQFTTCKSANRGECTQPCRRNYMIKDTSSDTEYEIGPNYVLSPKDLCTLPFIEKLVFSGIDSFKIEGRNKSVEYVGAVTSAYREIVDFIWGNKDNQEDDSFKKELEEIKERLMKSVGAVFNRGFSDGFYMGRPLNEWANASGNVGTEKKKELGKVTNFYKKIEVVEFIITTDEIVKIGDEIYIQGQQTGTYRAVIESMEINHKKVQQAKQGDAIAIKVSKQVHVNDLVYIIEKA